MSSRTHVQQLMQRSHPIIFSSKGNTRSGTLIIQNNIASGQININTIMNTLSRHTDPTVTQYVVISISGKIKYIVEVQT